MPLRTCERQEMPLVGGFGCLEVCLYDIRELATSWSQPIRAQYLNDLDQWEVSTLTWGEMRSPLVVLQVIPPSVDSRREMVLPVLPWLSTVTRLDRAVRRLSSSRFSPLFTNFRLPVPSILLSPISSLSRVRGWLDTRLQGPWGLSALASPRYRGSSILESLRWMEEAE